MKRRHILSLFTIVAFFAAGGASCQRRPPMCPAPTAFSGPPTLEEVIQVVNANSAQIQQIQATGATLSMPGFPSLRADLAFERPRRFRLRAGTTLTGPEFDLGSNDNLFWLWIRRDQPPAIYFCHHDQFHRSNVGHIFPVDPDWLIAALGVVHLDPAGSHAGPFPLRAGRVEVRSVVPSVGGEVNRISVIHDTYGWVLEQHLYDMQGRRLASAVASRHQYDPVTGTSLPRQVEIQLPPSGMAFTIDVGEYLVNSLSGDPLQLWSIPQPNGIPLVDLCGPRTRTPRRPPLHLQPASRPVRLPMAEAHYHPQGIRGFGDRR